MENQKFTEPEQNQQEEMLEPADIMKQFVRIYSQYVQKCSDLENYQSELERVQQKLNQKELSLMEQTSQNQNLKIRLEMLNAENQRLEKKLQESQNGYEAMVQKMSGFAEIYHQTEQSMQYYDKQNSELAQKLKEVQPSPETEEKIEVLQRKLEEAEEISLQYQQETEELQAQNKKLQTELSELREMLALKASSQARQEVITPEVAEQPEVSAPVTNLSALLTAAANSGGLQIEQPTSKTRKASDFDIDVSIIDVPIEDNRNGGNQKQLSEQDVLKMLFGM